MQKKLLITTRQKEADKVFLDNERRRPFCSKVEDLFCILFSGPVWTLVNHTERGRLMLDYFYAFCERYGSKISC